MDDGVTFSSILEATEGLRGVACLTPVISSAKLGALIGGQVLLKCENFQRTGAFKFRGAYHALSRLKASESVKAVATISSGNHGQGLALSAQLLGLSAQVIMPKPISALKYRAIKRYGGNVLIAEDRGSAEAMLEEVIAQQSAAYVHAFNNRHVIAGHGTIMLEFLDQISHLDILLAPVGGGGLLSGLCIAGHHLQPSLKIFACEPAGAWDAERSIRENRIISMPNPQTMAEGLRTSLGSQTLPILRQHLSGVFSVSEEEIPLAMRVAFESLDIVIEPSSAVALAPILRAQPELMGQRVGVVLTGGNIDLTSFGTIVGNDTMNVRSMP